MRDGGEAQARVKLPLVPRLMYQPTTATAGTVFNVTVHALSNGGLDTSYAGAHALTWGGSNASPSGAVATLPSPAWVSGSVTIPLTLVAADTETLTMTDGTGRNLTFAPVAVSTGIPSRLAFTNINPAPVTLPCFFTCSITGIGRGTTATFAASVTDAEGNTESAIGSGHTVTFTFINAGTGAVGTPTAPQAFPATGLAQSPRFTFTSSSSSGWTTATLTLAANATYASATAAVSQ